MVLLIQLAFHIKYSSSAAQNDPYECYLLQSETLLEDDDDKMVIKMYKEHKKKQQEIINLVILRTEQ